ncbi:MAG: hypothetical protein EOO24_56280 [Comamonadaceae bacterium]|nr:MAG: hypothetical protein EOO24_56280 [Comamonadaceae bacterium]
MADGTDEGAFDFVLPTLPADLPAGLYQLALRVQRADSVEARTGGALPVALAPQITSFPPLVMTRGAGNLLRLRIGCTPAVRVGQNVSLRMDTREAPALPFTADTAVLDFELPDAPPAGGTPLLRLQVDGIESVAVDRSATPPAFFDHRITLPA